MGRIRILFVDDEAPILEGLRDLLHREGHRWELVLAQSGEAALEELERAPCAAVVADMRMPGMDGAELLGRVQRRWPSTARLVLSGQGEREAVLRAMSVAQLLLEKPCPRPVLIAALERTLGLHEILHNPTVVALVGGVGSLPSLPMLYTRIAAVAADPRKGLPDIAGVVEQDAAMAARVLQVANSPLFGARRQCTSIASAVGLLGVELLRNLVLAAQVFGRISVELPGFDLGEEQRRAFRCARLCASAVEDVRLREEAFAAGLLADVGRALFAERCTTRFAAALESAARSGRPAYTMELDHLGSSHAEAGAYLLGRWGLPYGIVEAVAYHHQPGRASGLHSQVVAPLHVMTTWEEARVQGRDPGADLDAAFLEQSGCGARLHRWRELFEEEVRADQRSAA